MLTLEGCRKRQSRLLAALQKNGWYFFLTANYRTVYYLTGSLSPPETPAVFWFKHDGRSTLISSVKKEAAVDDQVALETYSIARAITRPAHDAAALFRDRAPVGSAGVWASEPACDTCRTFAVGEPTDLQFRAWELVLEAVRLAEGMIRPGVLARDVYHAVKDFLDSHEITAKSFWHHAGHGIGHDGHEAPRMIPGANDVFEAGDVITIEPGIYSPALQGGAGWKTTT
jgi:Xaa-Pro aminopeptidase